MKKLGSLAIALTLLATPSLAADMALKAPPIVAPAWGWGGFYVGANGGGGGGSSCWNYPFFAVDTGCHNPTGGLGGGQLGYNVQTGGYVFGAEISGDWANLKGSNTPVFFQQNSDNTRINSIVTLTGRGGVTWERALFYVKGGAAWSRGDYSVTCNGVTNTGFCTPVGATAQQGSSTRTGWTVGAGLEYLLMRNISLAVEYDYVGLGNQTVSLVNNPGYNLGCGLAACPVNIKQNISMATARLNWHFGGP